MLKLPLLTIGKIKFNILSPDDIAKLSEVEIKNHIIIQGTKPFDDGIYDLHMGTTDKTLECKTCQQKALHCPGHYGSYRLKTNVFHPLYVSHIYNILKIICHNCGKFINKKPKCNFCNTTAAVFSQSKTDRLVFYINKKRIHPFQVYNIFCKIPQEDVTLMGYPKNFHPTYIVPSLLLIPPNNIRPDMQLMLGKNSSNDITILIQNVVKLNIYLPPITEETLNEEIDKLILQLNIAVYELIRGPYGPIIPGKKVYEGALITQIPSKKGLLRKHILGKHVRYMARAIIVCKSDMPVDTIGISLYIARRIQKPVHVREYNFRECLVYFLNGTKKYPGSTRIKQSGKTYFTSVDHVHENYNLKIGDILFRDLIDGDVVNFNRQPTLDKSSISSMKVRIFPDINVIYMNVIDCSFFNADFDGDQMNIQVPYSEFTENEIKVNSNIDKSLISAKNTHIQISQVLDSLLGLRMLTYNDYDFQHSDSMPRFMKYHLLNLLHIPLEIDFSKKNILGRDLMTAYFQTKKIFINMNKKSAIAEPMFKSFFNYDEEMTTVKIRNGVMLNGVLDKPTISQGERSNIFHEIFTQYGFNATINAIFDTQQIGLKYVTHFTGYTISLRDCYITEECEQIIEEINNSVLNGCELISQNYRNGLLLPPLGQTAKGYYESLLMNQLESKDILLKHILKYTTKDNNLLSSISSGTKGKMFNYKNIKGTIGLITMADSMIPETFSTGRSSCFMPRHDSNMLYRGYCGESYIRGLGPLSFAAHGEDGRYAIIMKALSTSEGGTRQRQDRKCLETFVVNNKGQVASNSYILQVLYGGDSIYPTYYIMDKIHILNPDMTHDEFSKRYLATHKDPLVRDRLKDEYTYLSKLRKKYIQRIPYSYNTPVNIDTLVTDIINMDGAPSTTAMVKVGGVNEDILDIDKTLTMISDFLKNIYYVYYNDYYKKPIPLHVKHALKTFRLYLISYLNISTLLLYKVKNNYVPCIFQQIKFRLIKSFVRAGTPIGSITTMYINEPLMQRLLDAHHFSGAGITIAIPAGGKKRGAVDDVNELLTVKDTSQSVYATMKIYLDDTIQYDKYKVEMFSFQLKMVKFENICNSYQIINESPGKSVDKEENKDYEDFIKITNVKPSYNIIPLCIKIYINVLFMILHNIRMEDIYIILSKHFSEFYIIYNSRFKKDQYIKIYITKNKYPTLYDIISLVDNDIFSIKLKGINNIVGAIVKEESLQIYNEDSGTLEKKNIYYIETYGSNLIEVLMLDHVDKFKTTSNSVIENYDIFGIIAAKNVILDKLDETTHIHKKHSMIYADVMTVTGRCTSIDRYGSKMRDESILTRVSDASPVGILVDAAIYNKTDVINNASDAIIMTQVPKLGNNYNNFEVDISKYREIVDADINAL